VTASGYRCLGKQTLSQNGIVHGSRRKMKKGEVGQKRLVAEEADSDHFDHF
jgi:hypothetical protein